MKAQLNKAVERLVLTVHSCLIWTARHFLPAAGENKSILGEEIEYIFWSDFSSERLQSFMYR